MVLDGLTSPAQGYPLKVIFTISLYFIYLYGHRADRVDVIWTVIQADMSGRSCSAVSGQVVRVGRLRELHKVPEAHRLPTLSQVDQQWIIGVRECRVR